MEDYSTYSDNPIIIKSWKEFLGDNFENSYNDYLGYHLPRINKWIWNEKKQKWLRSYRVKNKNTNLIWNEKYQKYIKYEGMF